MTKNFWIVIIAIAPLVLASCEKPPVAQAVETSDVLPVAKADGKEYQIDTAASKITWIGTKITGKHTGTVNLKSGSVFVKEGNVTAGRFIADMTSIDNKDLSGEYQAKLNKHLKSEDFFDVVKFPEAMFQISSVEKADNGFVVKGNLTLKGITHGVAFNAEIQSEKGVPQYAKANFNIDRKKWGIVYRGKPDDLISDTVNLTLDLKIKK